jgi:phosphatidylethanolamine/phosphatidyl-N-methylethanolamine N-methyltransferase
MEPMQKIESHIAPLRHELNQSGVTLSDVRASYRRYAPYYNRIFGTVLEDGRRKLLVEVNRLQPARILEIGVGTGLLLPGYPAASQVVGVDVSEDMLVFARQQIAEHSLANTRVERADGERLNWPDDSFDCVVLPYVISVTPNPDALVAEAIRLCAPTGHILVLNHFSGSKFWRALEVLVAPLVKKIGFRSSFSYEDNILAHPWQVVSTSKANWMGLTKLVLLRPQKAVDA